jgi:hypothetical protein
VGDVYIEATKKLIESNGFEAPDHERRLDLLHTAPQVYAIPVVVLTSDKRFDFGAGGAETWPAWRTAQDRLATLLNAKHVSDTNSGHAIQMEKPRLVIEPIREVVEAVGSSVRSHLDQFEINEFQILADPLESREPQIFSF